jgi:hypothetical protein
MSDTSGRDPEPFDPTREPKPIGDVLDDLLAGWRR